MRCKDRMHEIVKNKVESSEEATWKEMLTQNLTPTQVEKKQNLYNSEGNFAIS